jgi:uncharacterized membrane protein
MKRIILSIIVVLCFVFPVFAEEKIDSFDVAIRINLDGTVNVAEKLTYDFGNDQRHGIYRDIPLIKINKENKKFKLTFDNVTVIDNNKKPYNFVTSEDGENLSIKIGDAETYVSGVVIYNITYTVSGALTYFDTFDELYWNVSGNGWAIPLSNVSAIVVLPKEISDGIETVCYTGVQGSAEKDCNISIKNNIVSVKTTKPLDSFSGLTIATKFPSGIVSVLEPILIEGTPTWIIVLISVIVSILFIYLYIYLPIVILIKYIKNLIYLKKHKRIVSAWFSAPKINKSAMSPAETYGLVYQSVNNKQLTATLIDLAHRGYLKIVANSKKDITFNLLKDYMSDKKLKGFERDLLKTFFGTKEAITLKDIKSNKNIVGFLPKFQTSIYKNLFSYGLLVEDIQKVQNKYSLLLFLSVITINIPLCITALLSLKSAKLNDLGIEKLSESLSLKNFLVSQDAQFNFQAKEQMFFEKLLPYATAFGVEKLWVTKFGSFDIKNPDWYVGDYIYLNTLSSSINRSIASSISSTNSSSGFSSGSSGGFSGGGGGGGGGGSW